MIESVEPRCSQRLFEVAALTVLVAAVYLPRMTTLPVRGEESRRATIAREMFETGDWIVPRQQHEPFLSRPPLHSWAMAGMSHLTGGLNLPAIRLPSVLGALGLTLAVFLYARLFVAAAPAFCAGVAMATFAQVIELGRVGETDVLFNFFLGSSLLWWHAGHHQRWPAWRTWCGGYALAALATLTKGQQAPIYFGGATVVFLLIRRDWRYLFSMAHLAGIATFALVFGAWLVPFIAKLGPQAVVELATYEVRFQFREVTPRAYLVHFVEYPFKVLACVLPWVALLGGFLDKPARRTLGSAAPAVRFALTVMAVAAPTLLFSPTCLSRHAMPLYPFVAVLVAIVLDRCHDAAASYELLRYRRWCIWLVVVLMVGAAGAVVSIAALPDRFPEGYRQPVAHAVVYAAGVLMLAGITAWSVRSADGLRLRLGAMAIGLFVGVSFFGPITTGYRHVATDMRAEVEQLRERIGDVPIISYGEIFHRFSYCWGEYIPMHPWPKTIEDVDPNVDYFCFGGGWHWVVHELPFKWERVMEMSPHRTISDKSPQRVVVGRRVRED